LEIKPKKNTYQGEKPKLLINFAMVGIASDKKDSKKSWIIK